MSFHTTPANDHAIVGIAVDLVIVNIDIVYRSPVFRIDTNTNIIIPTYIII